MPKTPINRFRNPYESSDDLSHATIFFVVILLLAGVAAIIFYGNAGLFANVPEVAESESLQVATPVANPSPSPAAPLTDASPVPLATPTFVVTPTPPGPPDTPTPGPSPTAATASPTAARRIYIVANTGGDGVYLRHTPRMDDKSVAWRDNTVLEALGEQSQNEGVSWEKVRDPQGNVGWVPSQYITPVQ